MGDYTPSQARLPMADASPSSHYTPSRTASRRASRHETPLSSSPHRSSINGSEPGTEIEESKLSALDPRRFTPTLHANLVAEILNLRREVDGKNGLILGLEEQLVAAEEENKELGHTINSHAQEEKSLRRMLDSLEGGLTTGLEKLAQEKQAANDSLAELKRRYEAVQKKLKTREDEVDRMNALWDSDRQHWDEQKRGLDRKAHVAETRMRMLLQELEAAQALQPERRNSFAQERPLSRGSAVRPFSRASASGARSHRRGGSIDSYETAGPRFSFDDSANRPTLLTGNSLADELNLGSDDEADDGYTSGDALPEERAARLTRPYSSQSNHEAAKARKVLGLTPDVEEPILVSEGQDDEPSRRSDSIAGIPLSESRTLYHDIATQWSPPPSPTLRPRSLDTIAEAESLLERDSVYSSKRGSVAGSIATLTDRAPSPTPANLDPKRVSMVSQACQTIEQPPSPPATPQSLNQSLWVPLRPEMTSVSTQTEDSPKSSRHLEPTLRPEVPFISVRRPSTSHSRQSSHEGPVLPPQTRSVSCQTEASVGYKSSSVQTDITLVDIPSSPESPTRKEKRFSTNTISTRASLIVPSRRQTQGERVSSIVKSFEYDSATRQLREIELSRKRRSARLSRYEDIFADFDGEHGLTTSDMLDGLDLAELTDDSAASKEPVRRTLQRTKDGWKSVHRPTDLDLNTIDSDHEQSLTSPPLRSPTLVLEDETGKTTQLSTTVDQVRSPPPTRPPPPIPTNRSTRSPLVETVQPLLEDPQSSQLAATQDLNKTAESTSIVEEDGPTAKESEAIAVKEPKVTKRAKEPDIRKIALITSGTTAHMQRPRSPSAPQLATLADLSLDPPFPVPDRSSSKKLSWTDEPPSPGPGTVTFYGGGYYGRKTVNKRLSTQDHPEPMSQLPRRKGRKSPSFDDEPPLSPSTYGVSSVTSEAPTSKHGSSRKDIEDSMYNIRDQPTLPGHKVSQSHGSAVASVQGSATSDTSVVDAIAQTMVGEWMWKYVRRRRSFGLPESPAAEFELGKNSDKDAQRHQRWVWLAPYERAVMWSSKQPTSGPALMGKSGRKLVIQSVLDVRDDTPMPKGASQESSFGRSILILTAQRALKFTAMSRDRHYIWLTALSFLSHSSVVPKNISAAPGLAPPAPVPDTDPVPPPIAAGPLGKRASQASLQRSKVHDSVRLAKGKKRPSLNPLATRRAVTTPTMSSSSNSAQTAPKELVLGGIISDDEDEDAAEPPLVPRFANHTRKRSNTGLGVPPTRSFRSFASAQANASKSNMSAGARSENGSHTGGWATDGGGTRGSLLGGMKRNASKRGSRAGRYDPNGTVSETTSPAAGPREPEANANFFEAIGTVGMEAFVDGLDKMASDLDRASGPGRRTKKRDSLQVLRERSRSIDRKRASRLSREQRRSKKKDSLQMDKANDFIAAMLGEKDDPPSLPSKPASDFVDPSGFMLPKHDSGDPFNGF